MLVADPTARVWTWDYNGGVFTNKQMHLSLSAASYAGSQPAVTTTVDPLTAIRMGLVTVDELKGYYPDGFVALLHLLKP